MTARSISFARLLALGCAVVLGAAVITAQQQGANAFSAAQAATGRGFYQTSCAEIGRASCRERV